MMRDVIRIDVIFVVIIRDIHPGVHHNQFVSLVVPRDPSGTNQWRHSPNDGSQSEPNVDGVFFKKEVVVSVQDERCTADDQENSEDTLWKQQHERNKKEDGIN